MLLSRRDASARNTALIFAVSVIAPTFLGMCLVDAQVDGQAELIGGTELVPADSGGALLCLAAGATPAPTCRVLDSEGLPRGVVVESGCERAKRTASRVISDCHIILGPIVTFGDRLSPPRQSPYKMRQSCDCHDCHTVTIVGSTCSTSTDYIGKLHTT